MIQIMLVDDEERARKGICTLIDWEKYGVTIVAEARDGIEALELLQVMNVDILITDIRMPEMDGLALIEHVSTHFSHIKCVVMSGFDDFSFAKKAITFGVTDYLLKPSRTQEILDTVLKLVHMIELERHQEDTLEKLRKGFRESFPLLKEDTLRRLVTTPNPPLHRLLSLLRLNQIDFPLAYFGTIVLQIDDFHSLQQQFGPEDIELYKYSLKNIAEETISPSYICAGLEHEDDILIIMNSGEWVSSDDYILLAQQIQTNIQKYLHFTVSIGLGSLGASAKHLYTSYREATRALNNRYYLGRAKIVDYTKTIDDDLDQTSYPLVEEKAILQVLLQGKREDLLARLIQFRHALHPESSSKEHIVRSMIALVFTLYRDCVERNLNTGEIFGQDLIKLSHIMSQSSLDVIQNLLYDLLLSISDKRSTQKNANKLFQSVLKCIHSNYNKDISRETVAREVFISPGYLSLLFKQELNMNFLEYLHQFRIEKASEYLSDRSLKITEIAHQVGYNDDKYFFQVFKKYRGMTPNQYRNQCID
ncbi:two-component system response regulator YesN [Paenibacillus shirakamiensis]|uniref:Two-component system response regulator YesN n=1 Tax=Paenibacillus shirakamiensis TaxID=1265935 RepID=A0ABS4JEB4_9BACL|nr:response regulator [Paenibacillus shirakamiensis]MBP2000025.1 two-component system response regulator YesN [Paenibacillus shirakamiensis]